MISISGWYHRFSVAWCDPSSSSTPGHLSLVSAPQSTLSSPHWPPLCLVIIPGSVSAPSPGQQRVWDSVPGAVVREAGASGGHGSEQGEQSSVEWSPGQHSPPASHWPGVWAQDHQLSAPALVQSWPCHHVQLLSRSSSQITCQVEIIIYPSKRGRSPSCRGFTC